MVSRPTLRRYRYVTPQHDEFVQRASFKLSTLRHLRKKEGALADDREGQLHWVVDRPLHDPAYSALSGIEPPLVKSLLALGNSPASIVAGNLVILNAPERYCYCVSRKYMSHHLVSQGMSICYEIADMVEFAHALKEDGAGRLGNVKIGKVNYDKRRKLNYADGPYFNDEFEKDVVFFGEHEIRISFEIETTEDSDEFVVIESSRAAAKMKRIR